MPRNIVLINPPWFFEERVEFLSQNLAIGYLAAYLEREGHKVSAIDALVEGANRLVDVQTKWGQIKRAGLLYEEIAERIPKETEIIGITAPFTHHAIIVRELSTSVYPLNGKLELEFITSPTIPCEIDINSRDNRELGILIRWLKLL